jgi:hypothetical protein
MNIYYIWQDKNTDYDTFDSAVVAAKTEALARLMHPSGTCEWKNGWFSSPPHNIEDRSWVTPDLVNVEKIGESTTAEARIICASFNAG